MRGFFIRLIGKKKREKFEPKKIYKILIPGGRVGDIVVKTPMLRELAKLNDNIKNRYNSRKRM